MPPSCSKRHVYADVSVFEHIDQVAISTAQSEVSGERRRRWRVSVTALGHKTCLRAVYRLITVTPYIVCAPTNRGDRLQSTLSCTDLVRTLIAGARNDVDKAR